MAWPLRLLLLIQLRHWIVFGHVCSTIAWFLLVRMGRGVGRIRSPPSFSPEKKPAYSCEENHAPQGRSNADGRYVGMRLVAPGGNGSLSTRLERGNGLRRGDTSSRSKCRGGSHRAGGRGSRRRRAIYHW